jgi:hypothetical protein
LDLFCGKCGTKLRDIPSNGRSNHETTLKGLIDRASKRTSSLGDSLKEGIDRGIKKIESRQQSSLPGEGRNYPLEGIAELKIFSMVLTEVIRNHVEALSQLTEAIVPYMISHNCIRGKEIFLNWGDECPATVENLLMLLPHTVIGLGNVANFGEVRINRGLSREELKLIGNKVEYVITVFQSSRDILETISRVTKPFSEFTPRPLGEITQKKDITNTRGLSKYEGVINKFVKEVKGIDWDLYVQTDPEPWVKEALSHGIGVVNMEIETAHYHVLYQYPYVNPPAFRTDIERYLIPFFLYLNTIDQAYDRCQQLFEDCIQGSGFLKNPPSELVEETMTSLTDLNTQFHGLYSAYSYNSGKAMRLGRFGDLNTKFKELRSEIDKTLNGNITMKRSEDLLKKIYELVLNLNEVEPVAKSKAAYPW